MSLPKFDTQGSLFESLGSIATDLFDKKDKYKLFATKIWPLLAGQRAELAQCYEPGNGRPGIEPVVLLGVLIFQFLERVPDRQAAELVKYHLGWKLAEVIEEAVRYVVRRNPKRAAEIDATRADKLRRFEQKVRECNNNLSAHPKASVQTAIKTLTKEVERLKLAVWVGVKCTEARLLTLEIDEQARNKEAKLDGCYVLKTDLKAEQASKEVVHDRYRDLALVEQAFRTSKTVELEMRPIHVRREASTRGHALVVMLAYRLVQELAQRWREVDLTVQEGLQNLSNLCAVEVVVAGQSACMRIPGPSADVARLIELAAVTFPKILCSRGAKVATKKKLPENRTKR